MALNHLHDDGDDALHNLRVHDDARLSSIHVRDDVTYLTVFISQLNFGCKNATKVLQLSCKVSCPQNDVAGVVVHGANNIKLRKSVLPVQKFGTFAFLYFTCYA